MNQFLGSNLFSVLIIASIAILTPIIGYAFKRISENRDCLEETMKEFTIKIGSVEGKMEAAETDMDWVKKSLDRVEKAIDKLRNDAT